MNISEVLFQAKGGDLNSMLPLNNVLTEEDKKKYIALGYNIGFSLDEFKSKFPNINTNHIYYESYGFPPKISYYDEDILFYTELQPILGTFIMKLKDDESDSEFLERFINTRKKYALNKNYDISFSFAPDSIRCQLLSKLLERTNKEDLNFDIYDIFKSIYSSAEFGAYNITKENIIKLKDLISTEQKELLKKELEDLPEIVTIYRGEGDKSTPCQKAISWTLNCNVANFFALRHTPDSACIYKAEIPKEKIIAYIDSRDEEEVLVDFSDIKILKKTKFKSVESYESIINKILGKFNIYKHFLRECDSFVNPESQGHDKIHCLRVLFLGLILAKKVRLKDSFIDVLAKACAFHDMGRINDKIDDKHGLYSYEVYMDTFIDENEDEVLKFLMEYHCKNDKLAYEYLEKSKISDKENTLLMYKILKDADALDRVRFGIRDLDINYLRLNESKKLLLVAQQCLNSLKLE